MNAFSAYIQLLEQQQAMARKGLPIQRVTLVILPPNLTLFEDGVEYAFLNGIKGKVVAKHTTWLSVEFDTLEYMAVLMAMMEYEYTANIQALGELH